MSRFIYCCAEWRYAECRYAECRGAYERGEETGEEILDSGKMLSQILFWPRHPHTEDTMD